ncbi:MAG TPA: amidohydrolase family protein [Xanthobacteraceae bacterium]|nr:amidohydrolase family protein [Xanthobacteraceae bacterium]
MIARRTFIQGASALAATASGVGASRAETAPNSSGSENAKVKAPPGACDCHHHIYDPARFPPSRPQAQQVPNARVDDYRLLQRRIGTSRNIVVTPAPYPAPVSDNLAALDAIKQLGPNARGVVIVYPEITDAELKMYDAAGVRGIRFSLTSGRPGAASTATPEMIETLSKKVNGLGWHVQFNTTAEQIVASQDLLGRLASPIVFDHMGHLPQPEGIDHPAFGIIRRLIDKGRTWVKLSVTYDSSKDGPPGYADVNKIGQAYVKAAPERLVWGSNWPHPSEPNKPDDAMLFDLLAQWAPDEAVRNRILVDNPQTLYGFAKVT